MAILEHGPVGIPGHLMAGADNPFVHEIDSEEAFFEILYGDLVFRSPGPEEGLAERVMDAVERRGHFDGRFDKVYGVLPLPLPFVEVIPCPTGYRGKNIILVGQIEHPEDMVPEQEAFERCIPGQGWLPFGSPPEISKSPRGTVTDAANLLEYVG